MVSVGGLADLQHLIWVVMITSTENRGWSGDIDVKNIANAGLPAPSVIRTAKIATIDAADATAQDRVSAAQLKQVLNEIGHKPGLEG